MAPLILILLYLQVQPGALEAREERLAALRARAHERFQEDRLVYSDAELRDIEARYRSAHREAVPMFLVPNGVPILLDLAAEYPKSTRAGCAVLEVAQHSNGEVRKHYLDLAIASHGDAWCDNGVQVGALARALLAMAYAELDRFDEAERVAREMLRLFPGAVDSGGAPLDNVLEGIKLLRPPERSDLSAAERAAAVRGEDDLTRRRGGAEKKVRHRNHTDQLGWCGACREDH